MSARTRGAAVCALLVLTVGGCASDAVPVDVARLSAAQRADCADLVDALPDTVADQLRRPVDPEDAPAAAWGDDEPIVLRCGVPAPRREGPFAFCETVNGLDWYAPPSTSGDQDVAAVLTSEGRAPRVEVTVPAALRPPATTLVDLSRALKRHTRPAATACQD